MGRRNDTRERMVATTGRLLKRQEFQATGTNQILAESGAPRGSLYFHFPGGKEQLAAEALGRSGRELGARRAAVLDGSDDPGAALTRLAEMFAADLVNSGYRDGCPLATVALEASSASEAIRGTCKAVYDGWVRVSRPVCRPGGSPRRCEQPGLPRAVVPGGSAAAGPGAA